VRLHVLGLAIMLAVVGCHRAPVKKSATSHYAVRGVVVATDAASGEIGLNAEAIPGFMEAMTMSYKLADPTVISELHVGDKITATLLFETDAAGPINMRLADVVVIAQARPDYVPKVQYHVPAAGDVVREEDQAGAVQGEGAGDDVYLYALSAGGLLPEDEPELCDDR